uniref:Uncharacterized protein n=1 Tax=Arundo donax TaxID=35708 RepID=A0A0A9H4F1_ARUDO
MISYSQWIIKKLQRWIRY